MKHMLGYLHLEDPTGRCVELINGARTLGLIRAARSNPAGADSCRVHPAWSINDSDRAWNGNQCWAFDSGQYGADPALWDDPLAGQDLNPWQDDDDPATAEVAGFIVDAPGRGLGAVLESPVSARVLESTRVEPLELVITGTVVAGSARGESAWLQWVTRVLTDPYSYRTGWKATMFTHCPDADAWADALAGLGPFDPPPVAPAVDAGAPPVTTWDDPTPPTLTESTAPTPFPTDAGLWQLFDVKFVSIEPLTDQPLFDHCVGRRYAITFSVGRHNVYDRPRELATIGGAGAWAPAEIYTNPLDIGSPVAEPDPSFLGPPGVAVPVRPGRQSGLLGRSGLWSLPDSCLRIAALTPARPSTLTDQLIIRISNPSVSAPVYNARIRLWDAYVGYPRPDTIAGDEFYRARPPVAEIRVVRIEPAETLIYDGRTRRITLQTLGQFHTTVPGRIVGTTGSRVQPPPLRCNQRYWAAVELSADSRSYGDLDLSVELLAAREQIPV